ncbi:uncharacterized protein LOC113330800 [Papaver somniferum]|uniref:uncharacterized protein LOC113330800 n=1 Tax=Papaver somniferum TaxID=3469 RepID=UPI000E6FD610|nr:uncharacterized protein LOC113330800 [Papaver somniferum]
MIKRAQEQGLLSGFQVKPNGLQIGHLQFADDTLIFLDADIEQVKNLRIILLSFEMLTGLKINFAKSQIFGVGYDGDLNAFSSLLGCYNGVLPTTYLGLPLGDKCGGVAKWDKVVDKFIARFPGWIKPLISREEIPISVLRKLEQIMRKFLLSDNKGKKKIHHVKWEALCKKNRFGGLGIKNLKLVNQSLLSKWSWRYATEEDVLWKQIIDEKYGVGDPLWCPKIPKCTYGRSFWRAIMNTNSCFLKHVRFKVNDGVQLRFWHDNWLYEKPIKTVFPALFRLSRAKNSTVDVVGI